MKKSINQDKIELLAEELSFWAFTGRWAIIFIIVGLFFIFTKEIGLGITIIAIALGYILFRAYSIKGKAKKLSVKYPDWWQGERKFFFVICLIIFMTMVYFFSIFAFHFFGILGVIILFMIFYGYSYLWQKCKLRIMGKIFVSLLPIILIVAIFYAVRFDRHLQDLNARMEAQNVETATSTQEITIENKEFGFKITYPSNWYKDAIIMENIILQLKPEDNSVSITIKQYDTDYLSQEEYMQYTAEEDFIRIAIETNKIELISFEIFKISNIPTYKIIYYENVPTISGIKKFKVMSMYLIKGNKMIGINYVALPKDFDAKLPEALKIIESITFQ